MIASLRIVPNISPLKPTGFISALGGLPLTRISILTTTRVYYRNRQNFSASMREFVEERRDKCR